MIDEKNKIFNVFSVSLIILSLTGIIVVSILRDRIVNQNQWTVTFNGQGKISYTPDVAKINIGVKVDKKDKAEEAIKELNEKINKILEAVEKSGIPKNDIQTQNFYLVPHYDYVDNKSSLNGYDANQTVTVKINNINNENTKISEIIKIASAAGANEINGITFEPSNLEDLKQQARIAAIGDAKNKAQILAGNIGVELKKVIGWWENYIPPTMPYYGGYADGKGGGGMSDPNIPTGSQEIIIDVSINYQVK